MNNVKLRQVLKSHYSEDIPEPDKEIKEATIRLVADASSNGRRHSMPTSTPFWRFTLGQLRFIRPYIWAFQAIVLAVMFFSVLSYSGQAGSIPIVMSAAVLSVAIAVPSAFRSFEYRVSELEYACQHNCVQVFSSRLLLFGLADVLWVTAAVFAFPSLTGIDGMRIFLYAATPFFSFCAVSFYAACITGGRSSIVCLAAAIIVVFVLWAVSIPFPHWYENLSIATWIVALGLSIALALYEARKLFQLITRGLAPQVAELA